MTGKELRRARIRLKMTQAEVAEALGLHENTIARIERGELPVVKTTELAVKYLTLVSKKQRGGKAWRLKRP